MSASNDTFTNARGTTSPFWGLTPGAQVGPPTTEFHEKGEFHVDANGEFFRCVASGTPGTWLQILDGSNVTITKQLVWTINGSIVAQVGADGFRTALRSGTIDKIGIGLAERGNNGDLIVDINMHTPPASPLVPGTQYNNIAGVTVYTTQANRPTLTGDTTNKTDNAIMRAFNPDIVEFPEGVFFSVDVDGVNAASRDLVVVMTVKINPLTQL